MRILGVIDLLGHRAVHARAGDRTRYQPIESVAGSRIASGDALALADIYINRLRLGELYVADLDAILGAASAGDSADNPESPQTCLLQRLGALGVPLWLDAGIRSVDQVQRAIQPGVTHLIVGLETLSSFAALDTMCASVSAPRIAFSLDLQHGEPVRSPDGTRLPEAIAARAAAAGVTAVIVLDLARVGTATGPDFAMIARIRQAIPGTLLLSGGGVRGYDDLVRLAESGCDGALIATALHHGRLTAAHVSAATELPLRCV
jgi:phosphoribosylformimino-5-aminoimidazole carboxamide ribotide isomerase